jgi:hypothetical protein
MCGEPRDRRRVSQLDRPPPGVICVRYCMRKAPSAVRDRSGSPTTARWCTARMWRTSNPLTSTARQSAFNSMGLAGVHA